MPWVRIDDHMDEHPKIARLGEDEDAGFALALRAILWSSRQLTDGRIPKGRVARLTSSPDPARLASRLVEVGLWVDDGEDYLIHDYLDYQPDRVTVTANREELAIARSEAGRAGGVASGAARRSKIEAHAKQNRSKREATTQANQKQNRSPVPTPVPNPVIPIPDPGPPGGEPPDPHARVGAPAREDVRAEAPRKSDGPAGFEAFWERYPKRVGKSACLRWWRSRRPDEQTLGVMLTAIGWQERSERWSAGFVPDPLTWLRQGRWEDGREAYAVRAGPGDGLTGAQIREMAAIAREVDGR